MRAPTSIALRGLAGTAALATALASCAVVAAEWGNESGAPVAVRPEARLSWYPVFGATADDLRRSLARAPLGTQRGQVLLAATEWDVDWDARWVRGGDGLCRAPQPVVEARLRVSLPGWRPPPGAPAELLQQWNEFVHALSVHEDGHVALVLALRDSIRGVLARAEGPCGPVRREVRAEVRRLKAEHLRWQAGYEAAQPETPWPPDARRVVFLDRPPSAAPVRPAPALRDGEPLHVGTVWGCYRLAAPAGTPGTGPGEFWSLPVRLDTAVSRRLGPTPLPFPDPGVRAVVTYAPATPALTRDTTTTSSSWQIVPPDTLRIVRTTGFRGEVITLRWQGRRFAGRRESLSAAGGTGAPEAVELVPVACGERRR